jgi:putative transposase
MYVPGIPVHVVQRGHNRMACFFSDDDYLFYKEALSEGIRRYGASLHAYCLMTNHIHLLMTPFERDSIQRVLQHLGRQYVQYINKTYRRSGSLWEGRHKGSMIIDELYLLRCYRYIELNPVTACMVNKPEEYPWSSFHCNALNNVDNLIHRHDEYMKLGSSDDARCFAYRELFKVPLCDHDVHDIRSSLDRNQWLAQSRFSEQIDDAFKRAEES